MTPGSEDRSEDQPFKIRLAGSGDVYDVPIGKSILEVLIEHGHELSSSCESGICGTCMTGLLDGTADHRDKVLSEADRETLITICVSRAKAGMLTLDL